MVNPLQVVFAIVLLFFLPGFLLIQALFPKKNELDEEEDILYRIVLGMAMSIVISILVGFALAALSPVDGGRGYFDSPYIIAALLTLCGVFFGVGYYRGAYPFLGRSTEPIKPLPIPRRNLNRIQELLADWEVYKRKILEYEAIIQNTDNDRVRNKYLKKRERLLNRVKEIDLRIKFLSDAKVKHKEGEEILEQLQDSIYRWRKVRQQLEDLELKLALVKARGERQREEYLFKKRDHLLKRIDNLEREISHLKDEIRGR